MVSDSFAVTQMWVPKPSLHTLVTSHLATLNPTLACEYPAVHYALLHTLYQECQRWDHLPTCAVCTVPFWLTYNTHRTYVCVTSLCYFPLMGICTLCQILDWSVVTDCMISKCPGFLCGSQHEIGSLRVFYLLCIVFYMTLNNASFPPVAMVTTSLVRPPLSPSAPPLSYWLTQMLQDLSPRYYCC